MDKEKEKGEEREGGREKKGAWDGEREREEGEEGRS